MQLLQLPSPLRPQPACSLVRMRIYGGASQRPSLALAVHAPNDRLCWFFLFCSIVPSSSSDQRPPDNRANHSTRTTGCAAASWRRGPAAVQRCLPGWLVGVAAAGRRRHGTARGRAGRCNAAKAAAHRSHEWTAAPPGRDTTTNQSLSHAAPLPACATREAADRPRRRPLARRFRAGAWPHHQRVALIFRHGQQARCSLLCSFFCCHGNVLQCC